MMSVRNRLERLSRDRRLLPRNNGSLVPELEPLSVRTAADVLTLLGEQVAAVRADYESSTVEKARTIGYLASVAVRTIETGNLEARIQMLESVLKQRH